MAEKFSPSLIELFQFLLFLSQAHSTDSVEFTWNKVFREQVSWSVDYIYDDDAEQKMIVELFYSYLYKHE